MSGPIIRKYGFPNFEKIFGERELKHGSDESDKEAKDQAPPAEAAREAPAEAPKGEASRE